MKLIFATHNQGKLVEMKEILKGLDLEVLSAEEVGVRDEIEEDADTCEGNALKKARYVARQTGQWAVADDSGIFINALNGAPGVHSARWSNGKPLVDFTLEKMKNYNDRNAYFLSVAALVSPKGKEWVFQGKINGRITREPAGIDRPKLPYDLIFQPKGYDKTFAQMTDQQKNSLSHRGEAFRKLREFLVTNYESNECTNYE